MRFEQTGMGGAGQVRSGKMNYESDRPAKENSAGNSIKAGEMGEVCSSRFLRRQKPLHTNRRRRNSSKVLKLNEYRELLPSSFKDKKKRKQPLLSGKYEKNEFIAESEAKNNKNRQTTTAGSKLNW